MGEADRFVTDGHFSKHKSKIGYKKQMLKFCLFSYGEIIINFSETYQEIVDATHY
jgi:hypothetical protein